MKYRICFLFGFLIILLSCKVNKLTGKKTYNFMDNSQLFPMAFKEYDKFLSSHKVINNTDDSDKIKIIGRKISEAAQRYFEYKGAPNYLKDYNWEYNLVEDETVNAWCMPGGKIVFYTGILPIAANDSGIATIMGHEVAHALADHGAQRMSASITQQGVGFIAGEILRSQPEKKRKAILMAYGIGTTIGGMLPFSRKHESEADKIGIELMAIAGYNVDEAAKLWERMEANSGGNKPLELLSTHPSNARRIKNLRAWGADAKKLAELVNKQ